MPDTGDSSRLQSIGATFRGERTTVVTVLETSRRFTLQDWAQGGNRHHHAGPTRLKNINNFDILYFPISAFAAMVYSAINGHTNASRSQPEGPYAF